MTAGGMVGDLVHIVMQMTVRVLRGAIRRDVGMHWVRQWRQSEDKRRQRRKRDPPTPLYHSQGCQSSLSRGERIKRISREQVTSKPNEHQCGFNEVVRKVALNLGPEDSLARAKSEDINPNADVGVARHLMRSSTFFYTAYQQTK